MLHNCTQREGGAALPTTVNFTRNEQVHVACLLHEAAQLCARHPLLLLILAAARAAAPTAAPSVTAVAAPAIAAPAKAAVEAAAVPHCLQALVGRSSTEFLRGQASWLTQG